MDFYFILVGIDKMKLDDALVPSASIRHAADETPPGTQYDLSR
jgi:hypothetical protein